MGFIAMTVTHVRVVRDLNYRVIRLCIVSSDNGIGEAAVLLFLLHTSLAVAFHAQVSDRPLACPTGPKQEKPTLRGLEHHVVFSPWERPKLG